MSKSIEFKENLVTPIYRPSILEGLQQKHLSFKVLDTDSQINRQNNPHDWLQQDILQITHFQYNFFQNHTLNDDTKPQIQIFARFLLKYFRCNYQLIWLQQDQSAYLYFPQTFEKVDLLPFNIRDAFKHQRYINPLHFHIPYFEIIAFDYNFIVERSETSDNRPYTTTSTTEIHTTPHNTNIQVQDSNELLSDTSESQVQYPQQSPQRTQPITQQQPNAQFENLSLQFNENHNNDNDQDELQLPKPTLNTQNTDLTIDSKILMVPMRPIENQDISHIIEQDPKHLIQGSSKTKPYLLLLTQYHNQQSDTYTSSLTSQQPSSSHNNFFGLISIKQSPSTPERTSVTTHPYTQAQKASDPSIPTTFNIKMIHTNPPPNIVTSRTLSRPPLQTIPNNPLQYNLSSTNTHNTQHSIHSLEQLAQISPSNNAVQHHKVSKLSSSSNRTNPYFTPTSYNTSLCSTIHYCFKSYIYQLFHFYLMVLIMNTHLKNIYNTSKLVLHFLKDYNLQPLMNINFGTVDEWLLYNALSLVQLSAGTFAQMTLTKKTGLLLYKLLRNNFCLKRMLTMHELKP